MMSLTLPPSRSRTDGPSALQPAAAPVEPAGCQCCALLLGGVHFRDDSRDLNARRGSRRPSHRSPRRGCTCQAWTRVPEGSPAVLGVLLPVGSLSNSTVSRHKCADSGSSAGPGSAGVCDGAPAFSTPVDHASRWLGAAGASATALQPHPHLLTTLPARAGGAAARPPTVGHAVEAGARLRRRTRGGLGASRARRVGGFAPKHPSRPRRSPTGPRGPTVAVDELGRTARAPRSRRGRRRRAGRCGGGRRRRRRRSSTTGRRTR